MAARIPRAVSPTPPHRRPRVASSARVEATVHSNVLSPQRPASPSLVRSLGVNAPRIRQSSPLRRPPASSEMTPTRDVAMSRSASTATDRTSRVRSPTSQPRVLGDVMGSGTSSTVPSSPSVRPMAHGVSSRSARVGNNGNAANTNRSTSRQTTRSASNPSAQGYSRPQSPMVSPPSESMAAAAGIGLVLTSMISPDDALPDDMDSNEDMDASDSTSQSSDEESSLASSHLTTTSEGGYLLQQKLRNGILSFSSVATKATSMLSGHSVADPSTRTSPVAKRHHRNRSSHGSGILLGGGKRASLTVDDAAHTVKTEARTERRILDLEITNKSLLAVNHTLEQKMRDQEQRIEALEEKLRRASFDAMMVLRKNITEDDEPEGDVDEDGTAPSTELDVDNIDPVFIRICSLVDRMLKDVHIGLEYQPKRVNGARVLSKHDFDELEHAEMDTTLNDVQRRSSVGEVEDGMRSSPVNGEFDISKFSKANQALLSLMNDDDDEEEEEKEAFSSVTPTRSTSKPLPPNVTIVTGVSSGYSGPRSASDERRVRYLLDQLRQAQSQDAWLLEETSGTGEDSRPASAKTDGGGGAHVKLKGNAAHRRRKAKSFAPGTEGMGELVDELQHLLFGTSKPDADTPKASGDRRTSAPSSASHSRRGSEQLSWR